MKRLHGAPYAMHDELNEVGLNVWIVGCAFAVRQPCHTGVAQVMQQSAQAQLVAPGGCAAGDHRIWKFSGQGVVQGRDECFSHGIEKIPQHPIGFIALRAQAFGHEHGV